MTSQSSDSGNQIDLQQPHAIAEWAEEVGVTPDELIAAVKKVAPILDDVLQELRNDQPPHPGLF
jgi:hypothetical protein